MRCKEEDQIQEVMARVAKKIDLTVKETNSAEIMPDRERKPNEHFSLLNNNIIEYPNSNF